MVWECKEENISVSRRDGYTREGEWLYMGRENVVPSKEGFHAILF